MSRLLFGPKFAPSGGGGAGGGALRDSDDADMIVATGGHTLDVDGLGAGDSIYELPELSVLDWTDNILLHVGDELQQTTLADLKDLIAPGRHRTPPNASTFTTWTNQADATATEIVGYGMHVRCALETIGFKARSLTRNVPAGSSWSVGFGFSKGYHSFPYSTMGLCLIGANGNVAAMVHGYDAGAYSVIRCSHTAWNSRPFVAYSGFAGKGYFKVTYDGTNIRWWVSTDGIYWGLVFKHTALDAFATGTPADAVPVRWGAIMVPEKLNTFVQNMDVGIDIWDWSETM